MEICQLVNILQLATIFQLVNICLSVQDIKKFLLAGFSNSGEHNNSAKTWKPYNNGLIFEEEDKC